MEKSHITLLALLGLCVLSSIPGGLCDSDAHADLPKVDDFSGAVPAGSQTDASSISREEEAMNADGESVQERKFRENAEKHEFQAEVGRLMDIIINSLYSNKDIFLRELISNGSDALDKIRFHSLTEPAVLGEGEQAQLDIRISLDKENKILKIRDRGVGMTKEDLINNLGTIAKSGTSAFLEQMQKSGDMNLIGQFGVGFYSVYLVADYVEVISKHNDSPQMIWESKADGNFAISEDTENEDLGRGTQINIHLKEDAAEYADEGKLKDLVHKYSEFINFPIYLYASKEISEEVPIEEGEEDEEEEVEEEEEEEEEEDEEDEDEDEDVEDEEEEEDEPTTKTVKKTVWEWDLLNDNKAIWLRTAGEVEEEEYSKFYKALSKTEEEPMAYSHFKAEGDVEFKTILFIPPTAPTDLFDNYHSRSAALKLYVRRVFISDEFEELVPKYLSFLKGIVDSDTLPLNVSREMLQQHSSLKTIKKKLVRKALDMIRKLAEEDDKEEDEEEKEVNDEEEEKEVKKDEESKYDKFWKEYGKAIKLGIIEDSSNRTRLAKLLRFYTSKSEDKLVSLEEYIERMKDGQKQIYYLAGNSMEEVKTSAFLERLLAKDLEVIYFTDPLDEYLMQHLTEFDDKKFANASKEDLKFGDKDDEERAKEKELKEEYKELTKWWKNILTTEEVENVKISNRLASSPCIVVTSKYGWSANMERIMKSQAMSSGATSNYMKGRKTLEINPRHPIIKDLKERVANDDHGEEIQLLAKVLYDTALLESGFMLDDAKSFSSKVFSIVRQSLDIPADAEVEPEPEYEEEEEAAPTEEESVEEEEEDEDVEMKDEL